MAWSRLLLALVTISCLAACKSPIAPLTLHDSGTPNVTLPDASRPGDPSVDAGSNTLPERDAGRWAPDDIDAGTVARHDAGSTPPLDGGRSTDAGSIVPTCSITVRADIPPLPSACVPRCTDSTFDRFVACTTEECHQMTLEADTSAPVSISINGVIEDLDCSGCVNHQSTSCAHDVCPAQTNAIIACNAETDPTGCASQAAALQSCIMANSTDFQTCLQPLVSMCFGAPEIQTCSITIGADIPSLPSVCLPRCSGETITAFNSCADLECQQNALESDVTPSTVLNVNGQPQSLDCASCVNYQQTSCAFDACPNETRDWTACDPMEDATACASQRNALQSCLANAPSFSPCTQDLASMCFGQPS